MFLLIRFRFRVKDTTTQFPESKEGKMDFGEVEE